MKKTLGGDRLGAGQKMQVDLHGYNRSTHDLSYLWRSTMSAGTLVPFMSEIALPGDTFDINLDCDIKTHPTIGPLFGSYKVQLDVFITPIRLYNSYLHNNKLGIGMNMATVKFPVLNLIAAQVDLADVADIDNAQINPSCILSYLGLRGIGSNDAEPDIERSFNGIPFLIYWDIYKQYYANKMEEIGMVIHNGVDIGGVVSAIDINGTVLPQSAGVYVGSISDTIKISNQVGGAWPNKDYIIFNTSSGEISASNLGFSWVEDSSTNFQTGRFNATRWGQLDIYSFRIADDTDSIQMEPRAVPFALEKIDDMREAILAWQNPSSPFNISGQALEPYLYVAQAENSYERLSSQEGLGLKTYQSDLFNNWLLTEYIDGPTGINTITAIDTSGGSFNLDTLNLSKKVYDMLNRIAVSGGTYNDWLEAVYAHDRYHTPETPVYVGGLIKELVFQEVISNTQSSDQPLGTLAGRGILGKKHKGGEIYIKVDEPSYITGIISLTPRIDYSQGNKWDMHLTSMDDLHKPALDEIGFQDLITEQMAWWSTYWDTTQWNTLSAGKQPSWVNYMTNVNQVRGNFAIPDNEMFMVLNRRYEYDEATDRIADLTTYVDPVKFNHIFAQTALDAQNFWAQIAVGITARRVMSARVMPNL